MAEQENVRAGLRSLREHIGTWAHVIAALGCTLKALEHNLSAKGTASGGIAIRVAHAAALPVEDVLSGASPKGGAFPRCGWLGDRA